MCVFIFSLLQGIDYNIQANWRYSLGPGRVWGVITEELIYWKDKIQYETNHQEEGVHARTASGETVREKERGSKIYCMVETRNARTGDETMMITSGTKSCQDRVYIVPPLLQQEWFKQCIIRKL